MFAIVLRANTFLLFIICLVICLCSLNNGATWLGAVSVFLWLPYSIYFIITTALFAFAAFTNTEKTKLSLLRQLRLLLVESFCMMMLYTFHFPFRAATISRRGAGVPIVLVHGYLCNAGIWYSLLQALGRTTRRPIYTVNFNHHLLHSSIESYGHELELVIAKACRDNYAKEVDIVAHSMGGLVARYVTKQLNGLESGTSRVRRLITLGSPHHGTRLAHPFKKIAVVAQQMQLDGSWTETMDKGCEEAHTVSIWSPHEEIVIPQRSAALKEAENHVLPGYGHMELIMKEESLNYVVLTLTQGDLSRITWC